MHKDWIVERFGIFCFGTDPGLGRWLSKDAHPFVIERIAQLEREPLTKVQFNQLLVISQVASVSDGFFHYYWSSLPEHPYDVTKIDGYRGGWTEGHAGQISSVDHLYWGIYRLYVDGLLFFGNVKAAFASLRTMTLEEITNFFKSKRFDTAAIAARGPALPLVQIARDDRYLISEMACKTFGELPGDRDAAYKMLEDAWQKHTAAGGGPILFKDFLSKYLITPANNDQL